MNRAEKIIDERMFINLLDTIHKDNILSAMKEIAWEAWKQQFKNFQGREIQTKDDFNQWFNKQVEAKP